MGGTVLLVLETIHFHHFLVRDSEILEVATYQDVVNILGDKRVLGGALLLFLQQMPEVEKMLASITPVSKRCDGLLNDLIGGSLELRDHGVVDLLVGMCGENVKNLSTKCHTTLQSQPSRKRRYFLLLASRKASDGANVSHREVS